MPMEPDVGAIAADRRIASLDIAPRALNSAAASLGWLSATTGDHVLSRSSARTAASICGRVESWIPSR